MPDENGRNIARLDEQGPGDGQDGQDGQDEQCLKHAMQEHMEIVFGYINKNVIAVDRSTPYDRIEALKCAINYIGAYAVEYIGMSSISLCQKRLRLYY